MIVNSVLIPEIADEDAVLAEIFDLLGRGGAGQLGGDRGGDPENVLDAVIAVGAAFSLAVALAERRCYLQARDERPPPARQAKD